MERIRNEFRSKLQTKPKFSVKRERFAAPQLKQSADPLGGIGNLPDAGEGWKDTENVDFVFQKDDSLQIQFCEKCGAMNMPEAVKCSKCGNRLKK